jgi:hypothetical protein
MADDSNSLSNFSNGNFFSQVSGGISSIGAGIGSLASAGGYDLEAASYTAAAQQAELEEQQTQYNTALKQNIAQRAMTSVMGKATATEAGNGLQANSGSGYNIMRENLEQGQLQQGMIGMQGAINEAGYNAQAVAANDMAAMAKEQASASIFGGIGGILGGLFKAGTAAVGAGLIPGL